MHPSENVDETEVDTPNSDPGSDNLALDDETENGPTAEPEAIGSFKLIRCKRHEHGSECMMKCAAGISCPAGRKHPYKSNVKTGLLMQCRALGLVSSCWYYYENGDICRFILGAPILCRYEGGKPD
ncbi:uncharacterized protein SOCE836_048770 [Sorangium cellulosum]|uniref:Uncharacterized protein n=1 Tax=Sorangium cellulosum TaxID=56 RepID=A0A4P2QRA1_SORCE|nr:uncharacterized protein SOCE836_048770 [Sorangium cellulosum]